MKIAVLSDIHGNIIGLKKCIKYINDKNIKYIIFCGDYISDIPRSHEVINLLRKLNKDFNCYFIRGNREDYIIDYINGNMKNWTIDNRNGPMLCTLNELSSDDIEFIKKMPKKLVVRINDYYFFISHKLYELSKYKYNIYGHTHKMNYFNKQNNFYLNPGSVGISLYDGFCINFAIIDTNNIKTPEFITLKYDTNEIKNIINIINNSELVKTKIKWDKILIKTVEDGVDYSLKYIERVIEKSGTNNLDQVSMDIWEKALEEIFNIK